MKGTGIFVTEDELDGVVVNYASDGVFLLVDEMTPEGIECAIGDLIEKYNSPKGTTLNMETGEFVYP